MKKILKKCLCFITSAIMLALCMGLTACEDLQTLEIKVSANGEEYTMTVDLYRHLAPETCKTIEEYVNAGYYNDLLIYENSSYTKQLMVGDLELSGDDVVQSEIKPEIYGEFENNGTKGSNLVSEKGSIGIWRSWTAADSGNKYKANNGMNSGRATWYIPTESISDYNGYFCVFAVYDKNDSDNSAAISALSSVFDSSDNYVEYVIYFTGEYDENKPDENYGLTYHCVTKDAFDDVDEDTVFEAKSEQLVCFNKQTVKISKTTKIVSVKTI